ncbi:unnamed protein product [Ectocarpus sp. CCAP 1310/34]|nr:unnamed protein product [Ectocarpus sp. CCAP 1310/34]
MFVDSASRWQRGYGMRAKSDTLKIVQRFLADMNGMGTPGCFRMDNGGEFTGSAFTSFCDAAGIRREYTAPDTPKQNAVVESAIWRAMKGGHAARRHILAMGHVDLSSIPNVGVSGHRLWLASALWASACFNRSATKANLGWMSPFEAFFGWKPPLTVVPFFQEGMMRVKRATQADVQSARCFFLHGANNHSTSTAVVLRADTGRLALTNNVVWVNRRAGAPAQVPGIGGSLRSPRRPRRPPPYLRPMPHRCRPRHQGRGLFDTLGKLSIAIYEVMKIKKVTTSSYHPQTNGGTDRVNHTMAQMLAVVVNEQQNEWDVHLPHVEFAYNNSVNQSTGLAPNEIHIGRIPRLPLSVFDHPTVGGHQSLARDQLEYCNLAVDRQRRAYELVREYNALKISRVERRNSSLLDAIHKLPQFTVGGWAWVYNTAATIRQGVKKDTDQQVLKAKFALSWTGPYKVLAVCPASSDATPDGSPLAHKLLYLDLPSDLTGPAARCRVETVHIEWLGLARHSES